MESILIRNGLVIDGTGTPGKRADVFIKEGMIAEVAPSCAFQADTLIDASGKVVCPGFVDIHRHHDAKPLNDPDFGRIELAQGITTAVSGNCGISMTPRPAEEGAARAYYSFQEPVLGPIALGGPATYREYMEALDHALIPLNTASMVGTGTVKICVKGFSDTPYTQEELAKARALIEDAMEEGAVGVSLGIMYLPECYSTREEFARILEPVGRRGGLITAHIRGEGDSLVESVKEVIQIAEMSGCALEISHFKSCGMKNWRREIYKAIDCIEEARAKGQDVTCDLYPYDGGSTSLTTMLPPVFVAGDMENALQRLGTPEGVEAFRKASRVLYGDWDNFCVTLGWDRIIISGVQPGNERFRGKTVTQAAAEFGFEDAPALAAYLMHTEHGKTAIINMSMCQDDIDTIARLPYSSIISDSIYAKTDTPHPRMYGAFPKVIREYVMERGLYTLEEAIRRMTGQPAQRMGLAGRGIIARGNHADILVFDPAIFRDNATYEDPARLATGLEWCLVNGTVAIDHDRYTGVRNGMNLKRKKA